MAEDFNIDDSDKKALKEKLQKEEIRTRNELQDIKHDLSEKSMNATQRIECINRTTSCINRFQKLVDTALAAGITWIARFIL
ncbi:MAG: hypothetical protein K0R98_2026 [Rickettsiaceae bacterium]|nr:hypothetical protein [Rickettsiaceae bacterium]